jgi:hypothetical protein
MKIADEQAWQDYTGKNMGHPYGRAILTYAERWADAMEAAMAGGETLEACADRTGHEADTEGITGFMYGAAVKTLADCWEHGDQLRRWHNLDSQIGTEGEEANEGGGVLNPAVLRLQ